MGRGEGVPDCHDAYDMMEAWTCMDSLHNVQIWNLLAAVVSVFLLCTPDVVIPVVIHVLMMTSK